MERLVQAAISARNRAYTPYSGFQVGCALLTEEQSIIYGCNVENASYGATNCAERTALFRAVSEGNQVKSFQAMAIVADTDQPVTPCGICRQVMAELCDPEMPVFLANVKGDVVETTVSALLPRAFTL